MEVTSSQRAVDWEAIDNTGLGYKIDPSNSVSDFYHYSWYSTCNEEPS